MTHKLLLFKKTVKAYDALTNTFKLSNNRLEIDEHQELIYLPSKICFETSFIYFVLIT
jgi:hypothetical protein